MTIAISPRNSMLLSSPHEADSGLEDSLWKPPKLLSPVNFPYCLDGFRLYR